jgi:hypothetical protein
MNSNLKRPLFRLINQKTKGIDLYDNNGSMWLIFTDRKKWVIELTKDGTLWYNYYFFQDCFKYLSLDVVENQHFITEWVESIIQNGVKATKPEYIEGDVAMEEVIQNGVKHTEYGDWEDGDERLDEIIQNGIKETRWRRVDNHPTFVDCIIEIKNPS